MGKSGKGSNKRAKPKELNCPAVSVDALMDEDDLSKGKLLGESAAHRQPAALDAQSMQQLLDAEADEEEREQPSMQQMEGNFMAALQRMMGGVELTDENVRAAIAGMSAEQRQQLAREGQDLKRELLTNSDLTQEQDIYRREVNQRAEAAGLPVEKDGEHLGKKVIAFMKESAEALPRHVLLDAVASAPYLVKLALAEAQGSTSKAEPADLAAIEGGLEKLQVDGWSQPQQQGRPPFVRRNMLLLYFYMFRLKLDVQLQQSTQDALREILNKASRLLDMLFQWSLSNRWVKPALAITETQALLLNGLWDPKDDACREEMEKRMQREGLKLPKLRVHATANDALPGETVQVKVEVLRCHAYSDTDMLAVDEADATGAEAEKPPPSDGEQQEQQPNDAQEGWWVIGEALHKKGITVGGQQVVSDQVTHNSLVGRKPLAASLRQPAMSCELNFDAPDMPGEYKIMVHVRSTGCVGVDARRKVSFQVLRPKRGHPSSSSADTEETETTECYQDEAEAGEMDKDGDVPPLTDDVPPLIEAGNEGAGTAVEA